MSSLGRSFPVLNGIAGAPYGGKAAIGRIGARIQLTGDIDQRIRIEGRSSE